MGAFDVGSVETRDEVSSEGKVIPHKKPDFLIEGRISSADSGGL